MLVLTKTIKPKKLQDKAMRLALLNAMDKFGTVVKKDFQGTTSTWKHKPVFEVQRSLRQAAGPILFVFTQDKIYGYVDKGTRPHEIWAGYYTGKSEHKTLAFPSAFTPKTTPGSLKSGPGSSGGDTVFTPYVEHPGSKPRGFTKIIAKEDLPKYKRAMEAAMKAARQASGNPA